MAEPDQSGAAPPDATGNWVDRWAPVASRPYLRLARADRPIGSWLLMWPCWWSLALATAASGARWPDPVLLLLFAVGALVMRGAGCTLNDIVDRDLDAQVARTRARPIASGAVSVGRAVLWMGVLALAGLIVLVQFNALAIVVGILALPIVAIYPFMKRFTYWPQFFLGLAFNWGALLGWAAVTGALAAPAFVLYGAGIAWTLGYDTIYAHQDKEDDALVGIKSTALKFGAATQHWLATFYGAAIALLALAGFLAGMAWPFYAGLGLALAHLTWQTLQTDFDNPEDCLAKFRANHHFGMIVFLAIVAGAAFT